MIRSKLDPTIIDATFDLPGGSDIRIQVLGRLRLCVGGRDVALTAPRIRTLVALLALRAGQVVTTDSIQEALWGDHPPRTARGSIQVAVHQLRALLGTSHDHEGAVALETSRDGYILAPRVVDAFRFLALADAVERRDLADDPAKALDASQRALACWHGRRVLHDMPTATDFGRYEIAHLEDRRSSMLERTALLLLAHGRATCAIRLLADEVPRAAERERLQRCYCAALYLDGRAVEAVEHCTRLVRRAVDRGLHPSRPTRILQRALLAEDVELLREAVA